jgi:two-component system response regulator MtrA
MANNFSKKASSNPIPKVLIICDYPNSGPVWAFCLQRNHQMDVVLETSYPLAQVFHRWEEEIPDLLIIDMSDPNMDAAINLVKSLRKEIIMPILLLSTGQEENSILEAYTAGVDECILLPISPEIFKAKVHSWLRRSWTVPPDILDPLKIGDFSLIPSDRMLIKGDGAHIRLTNLELRLLYCLFCRPGRVIHVEELIQRVWGYGGEGNNSVLKNVIYRLRRKIEIDHANPRYIQTVVGVGYKFVV